jgi:diguanylate cyclase (GGDEF)-like protein
LGEAEEQAGRDPLTALSDTRHFRAELERVVSQASRHKIPAALISVDVDDLKAVNEGHGRVAGDAALRHVARLLKSLIRSSDVAARKSAFSSVSRCSASRASCAFGSLSACSSFRRAMPQA